MKTPEIGGILETAVYVDDMEAAHQFYSGILGLVRMVAGDRLYAYNAGPAQTLLVFHRGHTGDDVPTPGGIVPGHDTTGASHFAFKIDSKELDPWRSYLGQQDVTVVSEVVGWMPAMSIYFKDPDGNILELASPPLWPNFME